LNRQPLQLDDKMDLTDYEWSKDTITCQGLVDTVNWRNVQAYASTLHKDEPCTVEAPVGLGGRHFVRILTFREGERWLARFAQETDDERDSRMLREADCLRIVAERSTIPIPRVFAVIPRSPEYGPVFMLMECLPGNVGVDYGLAIPEQHRAKFFRRMANAHLRSSKPA
jgi:aminoglycoside phosphotransferase (APT) family kinase protein